MKVGLRSIIFQALHLWQCFQEGEFHNSSQFFKAKAAYPRAVCGLPV